MSVRSQASSPITMFLGSEAGKGGPFALLGLPHELRTDEQVYCATNHRLAQVDQHRHRSTPDADEVRLAIHAAASQLLDQSLRAELKLRWPAGTPAELPKAWRSIPSAKQLSVNMIHSAKCLVAASGGWNNTARKRIAHFARVKRVPASELIAALMPHAKKLGHLSVKSYRNESSSTKELVPLEASPPNGTLVWTSIYVCLLILGVAVFLSVVFTHSTISERNQIDHLVATTSESKPDLEDIPRFQSKLESSVQSREEFVHYTAIAHELDQLVVRIQSDFEGSVEQFALLYPVFVSSWTNFPSPALNRSGRHLIELVQRAEAFKENQNPFISLLLKELKKTPNDAPNKSVIQSAVLSLLISDNVLPIDIEIQLKQAHLKHFGFDPIPTTSIRHSLAIVSGLIGVQSQTDSLQWWSSWKDGLVASTQGDKNQRDRLVLSVLSSRLQAQLEPSSQWESTSKILVNLLDWREGSVERYWLFRQFLDDRVNTPRLGVLTEAIAVHSSAPNVNAQMVLNPSSTSLQRHQMLKLYRQAWEPTSQNAANHGSNALANELHVQVSLTPTTANTDLAVDLIIELAKLNTTAWASINGQDTHEEFDAGSIASGSSRSESVPFVSFDETPRDTQWAFDALNAKDTQSLSQLFARLVQDNGPGIHGAYALVYLATVNKQSDFRSLASAQVIRYQDHPAILIALDHAIAGKRISSRLAQLIDKIVPFELPDRTESSYFYQAHTQLIDLLAKAISTGVESPFRHLESELELLYSSRVHSEQSSESRNLTSVGAARKLYNSQLQSALETVSSVSDIPLKLQAVISRRSVRLSRSLGPVNTFFAHQRGIAELFAFKLEAQYPNDQVRIRDVLDELDTRLNQTKSILDQLMQTERCIAQLWIIQLESSPK